MTRFKRRGAMSHRAKSPVLWERFGFVRSTTAGSTAAVESVIASPLSFEPNTVDSNWTIRRIKLALEYSYNATVRVAEDQPLMYLGLYMKDLNNPVVAAPSAPTDEDWLDIWCVSFLGPVAGELHGNVLSISEAATHRDVKSSRRLDQNEAVFLTQQCFHFTAAQSTSFQGNVFCVTSNLWSRTPRR